MTNSAIFWRAQGRASMMIFWGIIGVYTYFKYLT